MTLVCAVLGIAYSLRSWNPSTALGWVPVEGHAYSGDPGEDLTCERCGRIEREP